MLNKLKHSLIYLLTHFSVSMSQFPDRFTKIPLIFLLSSLTAKELTSAFCCSAGNKTRLLQGFSLYVFYIHIFIYMYARMYVYFWQWFPVWTGHSEHECPPTPRKINQNKIPSARPECCAFSSRPPAFDLFVPLYLVSLTIPGNSLINAHPKRHKERRQAGSYSAALQGLGSRAGGRGAFNGSRGVCPLSASPRGRQLGFPMAWWTGSCTWGRRQGASITHLWQ